MNGNTQRSTSRKELVGKKSCFLSLEDRAHFQYCQMNFAYIGLLPIASLFAGRPWKKYTDGLDKQR
jgi:hypothetical protein